MFLLYEASDRLRVRSNIIFLDGTLLPVHQNGRVSVHVQGDI